MLFQKSVSRFAFALTLVFSLVAAASAAEPVSTGWVGNTAIGGKDTVSYFDAKVRESHQVAEGVERFEVQHLGATWRFASQASADKFAANPDAYVPEYNGFCSNALALGEGLIRTDGSVWEFFGDRLHLFYSERGRQRWLDGDWTVYNREAAEAWAAIIKNR